MQSLHASLPSHPGDHKVVVWQCQVARKTGKDGFPWPRAQVEPLCKNGGIEIEGEPALSETGYEWAMAVLRKRLLLFLQDEVN